MWRVHTRYGNSVLDVELWLLTWRGLSELPERVAAVVGVVVEGEAEVTGAFHPGGLNERDLARVRPPHASSVTLNTFARQCIALGGTKWVPRKGV